MSQEVLVSVCIANYNGLDILQECLDSIINQDYQNVEIIVHDDCSTDDSVKLIEENYKEVNLIKSSENVGFCISNNRMVETAKGKYILLFNNDAVLDLSGVSTLVRTMEESSYDILTLIQKDYESNKIVDSGRDLDIFFNAIPRKVEDCKIQSVLFAAGACFFITKKTWNYLGGFPNYFTSVAEDLFICLHAKAHNMKIGSVNTSSYRHRIGYSLGGGGTGSAGIVTSYNRRYLSERNRLLTMEMLFPAIALPVIYIQIVILVVEGIILSMVKFKFNILSKIYIKAIFDYFKLKENIKISKKVRKLPVKFIIKLRLVPYKLSLLKLYGIPKIK